MSTLVDIVMDMQHLEYGNHKLHHINFTSFPNIRLRDIDLRLSLYYLITMKNPVLFYWHDFQMANSLIRLKYMY